MLIKKTAGDSSTNHSLFTLFSPWGSTTLFELQTMDGYHFLYESFNAGAFQQFHIHTLAADKLSK
jgi:hypothetical protein